MHPEWLSNALDYSYEQQHRRLLARVRRALERGLKLFRLALSPAQPSSRIRRLPVRPLAGYFLFGCHFLTCARALCALRFFAVVQRPSVSP
jgi:hypothetical protein